MTVLVHELCECGTEVPRRLSQYCREVVWCPNCKREFTGKPCAVDTCDKEASGTVTSHGHTSFVCPLHLACAPFIGMDAYQTEREPSAEGDGK